MKTVLAFAALGMGTLASATTLQLTMVADDFFEAYVSTSDTVQGTLFVQQTGTWQGGPVTGSIALTPNVVNYLHIQARDVFGAPSMVIGDASLSDGAFVFPNNAGALETNATDWQLSLIGFGTGYFAPTDLGPNGSGPWGFHGGISANARRLWSSQTAGEHYFSVALTPVPEPATLSVLLVASGCVVRRRRSQRQAR